MTLRDWCRVRTADRVARPRESWSAARTLRIAKRVFAQGDLRGSRRPEEPRRNSPSPDFEIHRRPAARAAPVVRLAIRRAIDALIHVAAFEQHAEERPAL